MASLTPRDLARTAWRTMLLQATWNYERQQGIGWAYAFQPVLERLYPDPAIRRARLAEHTAYFNTQPTLASLALGAAGALEEQRAAGDGPDADSMTRVKGVLGSALAALGDRLFWFTLRPFAAALGVLLAAGGSPWGAAAMWCCYDSLHLTLRLTGVGIGYRAGPAVLGGALRTRLETVVRRLALIGCGVLGILVATLLLPPGEPRRVAWQAALLGGLLFGSIAALRSRPSPTQWALGLGVLCLAAAWHR
jgi:PTS system mannose-specific IID component